MTIDWDLVKKKTLWSYEKLIAKLLEVLSYDFVQATYDHDMITAADYSQKIRLGYVQHGREAEFIGQITASFYRLHEAGIKSYDDLIRKVKTKSECERFLQESGFSFEALLECLNYLLRWVLPFKIPLKELLDTMPPGKAVDRQIFKAHQIRSNLDVLAKFRRKIDREAFAEKSGVDLGFLDALTRRADLSRLAFVRGKTIGHLCGGGYDTLEKLARANLEQMTEEMTAYYATMGKTFAEFKTVIPLDWMIGGATFLPKVVE